MSRAWTSTTPSGVALQATGTWVWPCRPCGVWSTSRLAAATSLSVMYSRSGSRGLPWTSVMSTIVSRSGRSDNHARLADDIVSLVHSAAARASGLNQSISRPPIAAASWLPRTPVALRSLKRATTASGSGP